MRVFSTFTGIGGFEIGIQNAYRSTHGGSEGQTPINHESDRPGLQRQARQGVGAEEGQSGPGTHGERADQRPLFVGYSEIDQFATKVYQRHYPGVRNYGDITKINASELPDFDCLVGGFPCQAFSIAGKRGGFRDTRGTLFFDLARIVKEKQPRIFVFENVKGLLSHDKGRTFTTILATIDELGYDAQWQVLNSKDYGVPQNRERIIIVGHLRGTPRPEVFPLTGGDSNYIKEITRAVPQAQRVYDESGIAPSVDTGQGGNRQAKIIVGQPSYGNGQRSVEYKLHDQSPTIRATQHKSGDNQPRVYVPEATKKGYAEATVGDSINLNNPNSKTRRGRVGKGVANTITSNSMDQYTLTQDAQIRRLTPIECERLQAFPDNWTEFGKDVYEVPEGEKFSHVLHTSNLIPMSDTQRYKMCGNAVTTNVIQAVFERIFATEATNG